MLEIKLLARRELQWSKAMDDASDAGPTFHEFNVPQDVRNFRAEKGLSSFHHVHRFVFTGTYTLVQGVRSTRSEPSKRAHQYVCFLSCRLAQRNETKTASEQKNCNWSKHHCSPPLTINRVVRAKIGSREIGFGNCWPAQNENRLFLDQRPAITREALRREPVRTREFRRSEPPRSPWRAQ